jgi:alpha-galactosidase
VTEKPRAIITRINSEILVTDLDSDRWAEAHEVEIDKYWNGEKAPKERRMAARLLYSPRALYVRFEANQAEPLVANKRPRLDTKTVGLWNKDVCEIFICPYVRDHYRYLEFEAAPTGEWVDAKISQRTDSRVTDLLYLSGMKTAARIESDKIIIAMKIGWGAYPGKPGAGDVWRGNLFRCIGQGQSRGYLAWQPTETERPNFHVPEKFGEFVFV